MLPLLSIKLVPQQQYEAGRQMCTMLFFEQRAGQCNWGMNVHMNVSNVTCNVLMQHRLHFLKLVKSMLLICKVAYHKF